MPELATDGTPKEDESSNNTLLEIQRSIETSLHAG
jgi:hypothetical protein